MVTFTNLDFDYVTAFWKFFNNKKVVQCTSYVAYAQAHPCTVQCTKVLYNGKGVTHCAGKKKSKPKLSKYITVVRFPQANILLIWPMFIGVPSLNCTVSNRFMLHCPFILQLLCLLQTKILSLLWMDVWIHIWGKGTSVWLLCFQTSEENSFFVVDVWIHLCGKGQVFGWG